jgi:hypothetical protein
MCIRIQAFKFIFLHIALLTKKEIIAILTNPTSFQYHLLTIKTLIFFILVELGLEHHFKLMTHAVDFGGIGSLVHRTLEKTFLA